MLCDNVVEQCEYLKANYINLWKYKRYKYVCMYANLLLESLCSLYYFLAYVGLNYGTHATLHTNIHICKLAHTYSKVMPL